MAAFELVHALTREPARVDPAFVDRLGAAGLDADAIETAAGVAWRYAVINRCADAFAFPLPSPAQGKKITAVLDRVNRWLRIRPPEPRFVCDDDGRWRPTHAAAARHQLLTVPGVTSPALRQAVEAFGAAYFGRELADGADPAAAMSPAVLAYVGRVVAFPAGVDDALVEALRDDGLGDEAIFELTLAASVGVASAGAERVAGVLGPRGS